MPKKPKETIEMGTKWAITSEGTKLCDLIKRGGDDITGTFIVRHDELAKLQRLAGCYALRSNRVVRCKSYPLVDKGEVWYVVFIEVKGGTK
jgi:hypothetical protein